MKTENQNNGPKKKKNENRNSFITFDGHMLSLVLFTLIFSSSIQCLHISHEIIRLSGWRQKRRRLSLYKVKARNGKKNNTVVPNFVISNLIKSHGPLAHRIQINVFIVDFFIYFAIRTIKARAKQRPTRANFHPNATAFISILLRIVSSECEHRIHTRTQFAMTKSYFLNLVRCRMS